MTAVRLKICQFCLKNFSRIRSQLYQPFYGTFWNLRDFKIMRFKLEMIHCRKLALVKSNFVSSILLLLKVKNKIIKHFRKTYIMPSCSCHLQSILQQPQNIFCISTMQKKAFKKHFKMEECNQCTRRITDTHSRAQLQGRQGGTCRPNILRLSHKNAIKPNFSEKVPLSAVPIFLCRPNVKVKATPL